MNAMGGLSSFGIAHEVNLCGRARPKIPNSIKVEKEQKSRTVGRALKGRQCQDFCLYKIWIYLHVINASPYVIRNMTGRVAFFCFSFRQSLAPGSSIDKEQ